MRLNAIHPFQVLAVAILLDGTESRSHPLKAEPVDHAHVYTFDQFYIPSDDDRFVREGGFLLLSELRCGACHAIPQDWQSLIPTPLAPRLGSVGSRMDVDALWRFIRSPQHRKPGTQMPGLFAGAEEDPETIEAIATYLASRTTTLPQPAEGDANRGRLLYHRVGCVACHQPGADYEPVEVPEDEWLPQPGLGSVPIALADDYSTEALVEYLLHPHRTHPSGRMPAMRLTGQEAADIAAYLHTEREEPAFREREILGVEPQTVAAGQQAFERMTCANCHRPDQVHSESLEPLEVLDSSSPSGCLTGLGSSGSPETGIPRYDLTELQQRALRLALQAIAEGPPPTFSTEDSLTAALSRQNCFACHDYRGRGGPESPRALYLGQLEPGSDQLPPPLDDRLSEVDLERLDCRPRNKTAEHPRPPVFWGFPEDDPPPREAR